MSLEKLTKFERAQLEREAHQLEEASNEAARKAQRIRRRLANAEPYSASDLHEHGDITVASRWFAGDEP